MQSLDALLNVGSISRFGQPFLVQSVNASLALRFRMDPLNGQDQFIQGAYMYHNGNNSLHFIIFVFFFVFVYQLFQS